MRTRSRNSDHPSRSSPSFRTLLAISIGLFLYSLVLAWFPLPEWGYILLNVGVGIFVTRAARRVLTNPELGIGRQEAKRGLFLGAACASTIVAVVIAASAAFADTASTLTESDDSSIDELLFDVLIRIPIGTAAVEELLFRGVLLGLWTRRNPRFAVRGSSLVFALWHIWPTLDVLSGGDLKSVDDHVRSVGDFVSAVGVQVGLTFLAGIFFARICERSGSVLAPTLAHAAANSSALTAAFLIQQ